MSSDGQYGDKGDRMTLMAAAGDCFGRGIIVLTGDSTDVVRPPYALQEPCYALQERVYLAFYPLAAHYNALLKGEEQLSVSGGNEGSCRGA